MILVFIKREKTQTFEGTTPCDDGDRDWGGLIARQGTSRIAGNHWKLGRCKRFLLADFRGHIAIPTPWLQTSSLQSYEAITFYCLSLLVCRSLLHKSWKMNTSLLLLPDSQHMYVACVCVCVYAKSLQLCLTLCGTVDCSPPGSSIYGIFWARILEWVVTLSSRGSSRPRDWTWVSCICCTGRRILYH